MLKTGNIILVLFCLISILVETSCQKDDMEVPEEEVPQEEVFASGPFYNQRYCEVLLAKIDLGTSISLEAYNTVGCNSCPDEEWSTLDTDTIQVDYDSPYARLNGPRYWVLDSISSPTITSSCDTQFGGIKMSLVATIPITLDDLNDELAYTVNTVERNTAWYYYKGQQVYILEDPSGKCFIMQSYSQKIDNNLHLDDLENLGIRLNMPSGWSYETFMLEDDLILESQNGVAELVSDDLENAYQYLNEGCL